MNRNQVDISTAHHFAKFLYKIINYNGELSVEENSLWEDMNVEKPIINNLTITTPDGTSWILHVKKANK